MAKRRSTKTKAKTSEKLAAGKGVHSGTQRLNKVLAAAGLGSRREVEELIVQGRVEVDRKIVTDLACKVDPGQVTIKVDGQTLKKFKPVYFVLNKPKGVLSTNRDPSGRMRVIDFVPEHERVFSVGRLDKNSEGLMLLTNDGGLAQRLAHPKYRVQKTYFVVVAGLISREELAKLRKGVYLAEGFARIDGATIRRQRKGSTELEIVLSEGKNREIRRLLARAGHKVLTLRRIAIGPLRLGQLPVGAARLLKPSEVKALYTAATESKKRKPSSRRGTSDQPQVAKPASPPLPDDESLLDSVLNVSDEGWMSAEDDEYTGEFSGLARDGSVLAYDESDSASSSTSRPRRPRGAGRTSSRRAAGSSPRRKGSSDRKSTSPKSARGRNSRASGSAKSSRTGSRSKSTSKTTARSSQSSSSGKANRSGRAQSSRPAKGTKPAGGRSTGRARPTKSSAKKKRPKRR